MLHLFDYLSLLVELLLSGGKIGYRGATSPQIYGQCCGVVVGFVALGSAVLLHVRHESMTMVVACTPAVFWISKRASAATSPPFDVGAVAVMYTVRRVLFVVTRTVM